MASFTEDLRRLSPVGGQGFAADECTLLEEDNRLETAQEQAVQSGRPDYHFMGELGKQGPRLDHSFRRTQRIV